MSDATVCSGTKGAGGTVRVDVILVGLVCDKRGSMEAEMHVTSYCLDAFADDWVVAGPVCRSCCFNERSDIGSFASDVPRVRFCRCG